MHVKFVLFISKVKCHKYKETNQTVVVIRINRNFS